MADDGRPVLNPLAAWGSVMASARTRLTTAQVWDRIREAFPRDQYRYPATILADVNRLRATAGGLVETSRRLGRAPDDQVLSGRLIAQQIYARGLNAQELAPSFHARFSVPVTTPEGTRQEWYTFQYDGALPATVGELRANIAMYAQALGGDYGVDIGEVDDIELGAY